jgi:transposase-like protein
MKGRRTDGSWVMVGCPNCRATGHQIKDGHNRSGSQRYKCKVCGCTYTPQPNCAGYPDDIRRKAVMLYQSGMSFRAIGRTLGINHQTVANWVNGHFIKSPDGGDGRRG